MDRLPTDDTEHDNFFDRRDTQAANPPSADYLFVTPEASSLPPRFFGVPVGTTSTALYEYSKSLDFREVAEHY